MEVWLQVQPCYKQGKHPIISHSTASLAWGSPARLIIREIALPETRNQQERLQSDPVKLEGLICFSLFTSVNMTTIKCWVKSLLYINPFPEEKQDSKGGKTGTQEKILDCLQVTGGAVVLPWPLSGDKMGSP